MKVPLGWNPHFWNCYGRAIPLSVAKLPRFDLRTLGPITCAIKPRGIGTDQEGWSVSEKEIEVGTLEGAIILGINLLNRE